MLAAVRAQTRTENGVSDEIDIRSLLVTRRSRRTNTPVQFSNHYNYFRPVPANKFTPTVDF